MVGSPERLGWRRVLAPALSLSIGALGVWGVYIGKEQMDAKNMVVNQYMGTDGCLTGSPYDDKDGARDNIEAEGIGMPGPTIINVKPIGGHNDLEAIHLVYGGTADGVKLVPAEQRVSSPTLMRFKCPLPDGP